MTNYAGFRVILIAAVLSTITEAVVAEQVPYQERDEFVDVSLSFSFHDFLFDFEVQYEPILSGKVAEQHLRNMGIHSDVTMSEEGLSVLREAAANELDELTNDLRKQEQIADKICAELANSDVVKLNNLVVEWGGVPMFSKLRRYEEILGDLSKSDRDILDLVYFESHLRPRPPMPQPTEEQMASLSTEQKERFLEFFSEPLPKPKPRWPKMRLPVNAQDMFDTLAREYPEKVIQDANGACQRSKASRGKRLEKYVNYHPNQPQYDDSGNLEVVLGSSDSGYRLVDE